MTTSVQEVGPAGSRGNLVACQSLQALATPLPRDKALAPPLRASQEHVTCLGQWRAGRSQDVWMEAWSFLHPLLSFL
jgi:hypothetical protein